MSCSWLVSLQRTVSCETLAGSARDLAFFVDGNDQDSHGPGCWADVHHAIVDTRVFRVLDGDAECVELGADSGPHRDRMPSDTAAEHQCVDAVEHGEIRTDVLASAVAEHVQGEPSASVTRVSQLLHAAHVSLSAKTQEPALPLQQCRDCRARTSQAFGEVAWQRGVQVSRAGT